MDTADTVFWFHDTTHNSSHTETHQPIQTKSQRDADKLIHRQGRIRAQQKTKEKRFCRLCPDREYVLVWSCLLFFGIVRVDQKARWPQACFQGKKGGKGIRRRKWEKGREKGIAHISPHRHHQRWCTFFKPVYFLAKRVQNFGLFFGQFGLFFSRNYALFGEILHA